MSGASRRPIRRPERRAGGEPVLHALQTDRGARSGWCALVAAGVWLAACAGPDGPGLRLPWVARESGAPAPVAEEVVRVREAPVPEPLRPPEPESREAWIDVEQPMPQDRGQVDAPWLEVRGFAGTHLHRATDVAIAIDVSGSTRFASGVDVDDNGIVGVRRIAKPWEVHEPWFDCSDPGDTVLAAERMATRALIERLDPVRTRIGLVSFSDVPALRAPVGSDAAALDRALEEMRDDFGSGATNLAEAIRLAMRLLEAAVPAQGPAPGRIVLVLSDGAPNRPGGPARAAEEVRVVAEEARAADVVVTTVALGADAQGGEPARGADVFAELAARTGGEHVRMATAGDVVEALPRLDLAQVDAVEVKNLTTGLAARALRLRPDGGFDAYVWLRPGENRLRFTARGAAGGSAEVERVVQYTPGVSDPQALERVRKEIELRTLQIELEAEVKARRAQRKQIELEPGP